MNLSKKYLVTCLTTCFVCTLLLFGYAQAEVAKTLTAPEVKEMLEKNNATLINVLSAIEYEMQHIPGSINIPIIQMKATDLLPQDKSALLIFYCMGLR